MAYAPIMDVEYLRRVSDIPANVPDVRLQDLIEEAENTIREYCNNSYRDGLPLSYRKNIKKMVEFDLNRKTGLSSEGLSRHSQGFAQDYPADVFFGLKRRLSW
ncbi:hypothetical protein B0H99_101378 [Planomicrobium soli]|uniref:Gp6-like head-tail connector protein n=1 Tax=Planomicrobium soli TaxID=1176648 RepID=A0A2P8H7G5_9BACL|nr:hypothetical protein [Planomicrobium soli]PSL42130.1 hypothetical protein B0H99_101378 [Planomicrobium soli]